MLFNTEESMAIPCSVKTYGICGYGVSPHILLPLIRYVERNPLRAKLVRKAENWKLSSLWRREHGIVKDQKLLTKWPIEIPEDYLQFINEPQTALELEDVRHGVIKSKPYGDIEWVEKISTKLGLEQTLHAPGRPKKNGD